MGDEPVHQALLDEGGQLQLDVVERHLGVAPYQALVGPQPVELPGGRGHEACVRLLHVVRERLHKERVHAGLVRMVGGPGDPALEAALDVDGGGVQVGDVEGGGLAGAGVGRGNVGEEEGLAGEGAPEEGAELVGEGHEEALLEEPVLVLGEVGLEPDEVAAAEGRAQGEEDGGEGPGLRALEEAGGGEAAQEDVGGDEVGQDVGAVGGEARRGLEVGGLEAICCSEVVVSA